MTDIWTYEDSINGKDLEEVGVKQLSYRQPKSNKKIMFNWRTDNSWVSFLLLACQTWNNKMQFRVRKFEYYNYPIKCSA